MYMEHVEVGGFFEVLCVDSCIFISLLTQPTLLIIVAHPYQTQFYLQVSVGKMIYDPKKGKGMKVRGEALCEVFIVEEADTALHACFCCFILVLFSVQGGEYYVSGNSDLSLIKDGIHKCDSTTRYKWMLGNWLNFSRIHY